MAKGGIGAGRGGLALTATLLLGASMAAFACAQTRAATSYRAWENTPELALTYDLERAKIVNTSCACFWLQGGSIEAAVPLTRGFRIAGSFTGQSAANIQPGVNLSKLTYLARPRYTVSSSRFTGHHNSKVFGDLLFGGVHGFNSVFPGSGAPAPTAKSFALQIGGGPTLHLPIVSTCARLRSPMYVLPFPMTLPTPRTISGWPLASPTTSQNRNGNPHDRSGTLIPALRGTSNAGQPRSLAVRQSSNADDPCKPPPPAHSYRNQTHHGHRLPSRRSVLFNSPRRAVNYPALEDYRSTSKAEEN